MVFVKNGDHRYLAEIEIEKTAPAQQPIAPAPPLKKEAEIVLDQKQAVTTDSVGYNQHLSSYPDDKNRSQLVDHK